MMSDVLIQRVYDMLIEAEEGDDVSTVYVTQAELDSLEEELGHPVNSFGPFGLIKIKVKG